MRIHNTKTALLRLMRRAIRLAARLGIRLILVLFLLESMATQSHSQFQGQNPYGGGYGGGGYGGSSGFGSNSFGGGGFGSGGFGGGFGSNRSSTYGSDQSSRSSQTDRSSRRRKRTEADKKGGPDRARAQGKSTVVKRAAPARKKAAGKPASLPLPPIKMDPLLIEDATYFDPTFLDVAPGDEFMTSLFYFNSKSHLVKEANLWVHYDPRALKPLWINTEALKSMGAQPLDVKVWRETGYIRLKCALTKPIKGDVTQLADFHWQALLPTENSAIELAAPEGESVSLLAGGLNVIKTNGRGNTLRVSSIINIKSNKRDLLKMRMASEVRDAMLPPPTSAAKRVQLAIVPRKTTVETNEVATADVCLSNPSVQAFDELKFRIRYDPTSVKILDADKNNYIDYGINIFDGDFHAQYPFGVHIANNVDPDTGRIDYHVCSISGPMIYPSGTVARIAYRMLRQTGKAAFWFEPADSYTGERVTDVSIHGGRSLLGESVGLAREAMRGAEIHVSLPALTAPPADKKSAKI